MVILNHSLKYLFRILRNCKVSRVLPLIADTAKNDRSAVLRARGIRFTFLHVLPFTSCKIINDEDGGKHKRYPSLSLHEREVQLSRASSHAGSTHFGVGTSAIIAMDKGGAISSESLSSSSLLLSQSKTIGRGAERSTESMLSSSKQKVSAIESLLKGELIRHPLVILLSHLLRLLHIRPLRRSLRKQVVPRTPASGRRSFDNGHVPSNDMCGYMDGPTSLNDALSEGLSESSDWTARVAAFNFIQILLQQGQKGIQDITQNFEKVMKLFFRYLDDSHHKVAQAAFSTLADIIPAFEKHFEIYVERILPYIFSRLIDPKELVRQPCSSTLEIVGRTYSIDTLLPALVRSLDQQRSPKAKLAVIEFGNKSFENYTVNSEGYINSGFLKLWLTKLAHLIHEKNAKLKEASTSGIISVYSHFDSSAVLSFILRLSIDEQNFVRRSLKQYTPRIEVDLVNYLQNKKERPRPKSYDQVDSSTSSEDGYSLTLKKSFPFGRFSDSLLDTESGTKMNTAQESTILPIGRTSSDVCIDHAKQCFERASEAEGTMQSMELKNNNNIVVEAVHSWADYPEKSDATMDDENSTGTTRLGLGHEGCNSVLAISGEHTQEADPSVDLSSVNIILDASSDPSVPQLLHQIGNDGEVSSLDKQEALQKLLRASINKDKFIWKKYFNQIFTTVIEVLDDVDSSVREISLLLVAEMVQNQIDSMEESIEIILEKLLHMTKDNVGKVSNEAHQCLYIVLAKYDPLRCLAIIVPLLASDDEKTLVVCINCLTKLVGRLSQEELVTQLPSFLPAVFDAFNNQSPDVRKAVVFCLVDIYIILGKEFVPYLEGLSTMQLRLVTIYANRISQARSGAPADAAQ
ncbi:hypothetical protein HU200_013062 [Digitaria exilis]|uniref:TOG domain-containing protein n=1 Tax=Digitaria exilis TaxID=1010633 RepID=A0A835KMP2_9POAL|nr:hypothetical protein HU200_013062 [Digitaria exilis]